jgi:hypothetical protein
VALHAKDVREGVATARRIVRLCTRADRKSFCHACRMVSRDLTISCLTVVRVSLVSLVDITCVRLAGRFSSARRNESMSL